MISVQCSFLMVVLEMPLAFWLQGTLRVYRQREDVLIPDGGRQDVSWSLSGGDVEGSGTARQLAEGR